MVQQAHGGAEQIGELSVPLGGKSMKAIRTPLASTEPATCSPVAQPTAATRATTLAVAQAAEQPTTSTRCARITDPSASAGTTTAATTEPAAHLAHEVAQMRMTARDRAAGSAARRLSRRGDDGLSSRLGLPRGPDSRRMAGSKVLLVPHAGEQSLPETRPVAAQATTRSGKTVVAVVEEPKPRAKTTGIPGSWSAATVSQAATILPAAVVAIAMEQAAAFGAVSPEAIEQRTGAPVKRAQGLLGVGVVVLRIVSVGDRRRHVRSAGRVVVSRNLAGNGVVQSPAIRPNRCRSYSQNGGHCKHEWRASPFSETHGQSLTYSSMESSWSIRNPASLRPTCPCFPARERHYLPWPDTIWSPVYSILKSVPVDWVPKDSVAASVISIGPEQVDSQSNFTCGARQRSDPSLQP